MKKITDERLKALHLKYFKWAFVFENSLLLLYLCYQTFFSKTDWTAIWNFTDPLWVIFMAAVIFLAISEQSITAALNDYAKLSVKKILLYFIIEVVCFSIFWYLIFSFQYFWLAVGCGSLVALVVTGVLSYNNQYRE